MPVMKGPMHSFWGTGTGWGSVRVNAGSVFVSIEEGALPLRSLRAPGVMKNTRVRSGKREMAYTVSDGVVRFNEELRLGPGEEIRLTWGAA